MARTLRIYYPDALYYLTNRSNERKWIFRNDKDKQRIVVIESKMSWI
jgi:REP element-mobilizing transposase RayT